MSPPGGMVLCPATESQTRWPCAGPRSPIEGTAGFPPGPHPHGHTAQLQLSPADRVVACARTAATAGRPPLGSHALRSPEFSLLRGRRRVPPDGPPPPAGAGSDGRRGSVRAGPRGAGRRREGGGQAGGRLSAPTPGLAHPRAPPRTPDTTLRPEPSEDVRSACAHTSNRGAALTRDPLGSEAGRRAGRVSALGAQADRGGARPWPGGRGRVAVLGSVWEEDKS